MQLDKHERNKLIGKILKSTAKDYSDNPELISRLSECQLPQTKVRGL